MVGAVFVDELGQLSQWECLRAKLFLKAHRENGWTNREKHLCYSAFWCQNEFPPKTENNEFTGNCPGITWCKTSEEPLTGHHQPSRQWWKHIPEKLRKAVRLKGLAGAVGKKFYIFQTWFLRRIFLYWTRPDISQSVITELIVLVFHHSALPKILSCIFCALFSSLFFSPFFFLLKARLITNAVRITNTVLICQVLLTTGSLLITHSPRSEEDVLLRDSIEKCFFVSVSSAWQQSPGRQPPLLGLLSVSNTSSLESEAWMLFFKP